MFWCTRSLMIRKDITLTTFPIHEPQTLQLYFKIVHAIAHRKYYRDWMTKVGVALPWIGGVCLILFPAMGTTRIVNGRCLRMGVWPNEAMAMVSH